MFVPVSSIAAVARCLAPHAVELRLVAERHALSARLLRDAGLLGAEHGHGLRVDVHVLDVDLAVQVQLRPMQQKGI